MRPSLFALALLTATSANAAWLKSGSTLPAQPPTAGDWHKIQFSYSTSVQPWHIAAQVRHTLTGESWPADSGGDDGERAIAHGNNGYAIYASTLAQNFAFQLVHYHPNNHSGIGPWDVYPGLITVPANLAGYANVNPLTIEWGVWTPGPKLVGSIAAVVNGAPMTLTAISIPEPATAVLLLVGGLGLRRRDERTRRGR